MSVMIDQCTLFSGHGLIAIDPFVEMGLPSRLMYFLHMFAASPLCSMHKKKILCRCQQINGSNLFAVKFHHSVVFL